MIIPPSYHCYWVLLVTIFFVTMMQSVDPYCLLKQWYHVVGFKEEAISVFSLGPFSLTGCSAFVTES